MDFDSIKKLKHIPLIYFPIYSWFYILEKSNSNIHLLVLISLLLLSHIFLDKVFFIISKFSSDEIKQLKKKNKHIAHLEIIQKIKSLYNIREWNLLGLYLCLYLAFCILAIFELIILIKYKIALLLLLIGPIYIFIFIFDSILVSILVFLNKYLRNY